MATRLWTRTSFVSIRTSGEELGDRRGRSWETQRPQGLRVQTSGCPHLQDVGETEATDPSGGDSWAPQDAKHSWKHSTGGKNPRQECERHSPG